MTTTIQTTHVSFRYRHDDFPALQQISTEFGPGIHGIIGPNGAGKSTLLRVIAGILPPTSGTVTTTALECAPYGYLGHRAGLTDALTIRDNLEYWSRAIRIHRDDTVGCSVSDVMDIFDIAGLADRLVSTLSRGQRQRTALARMFLADPQVLLLDEPFSNVDAAAYSTISTALRTAARERGVTVILSSHDLSQVQDIADMLLVLRDGRIVLHQPLEHVLSTDLTVPVRFESTAGFATFAEHELDQIGTNHSRSGSECTLLLPNRTAISEFVSASVSAGFPIYAVQPHNILNFLVDEGAR